MPKFSVITPVHLWNDQRIERFKKTIESVADQTFRDFEWIIVDDGSTKPFDWEHAFEGIENFKLIRKQHEERVVAYNEAFKQAEGEWFMLLDSDDEYFLDTLEELSSIIDANPEYKMINFGNMFKHKDHKTMFRGPFKPAELEVGHEKFGGGNIVNGTFAWHRSVYDDLGAYPPANLVDVDCTPLNYGGIRNLWMGSPYDFSAAAQLEFPETREYFMVDHEAEPAKIIKELGNPWGQDWFIFYKYTRKYHSKPIDQYLYIVNPR